MVEYTSGCSSFKLLLLQDAFKILHPLLQVSHVSWQVTVEKAHWVAKHCHPRADTPFIPLGVREKGKERAQWETDPLCIVSLK